MDTLARHQGQVGDKMTVFESKFRQLMTETIQLSKTVKQDLDESIIVNDKTRN
jgi:hypothetical protein